jgi:glucokinase
MVTLLAGDIGGTKTILRLVETRGGLLTARAERTYASKAYSGLAPMVVEFLAAAAAETGGRARPAAACFGVAGPVAANTSRVTNLPWTLAGERLARELAIARVELINDFTAIGHGVTALPPAALHTLQAGRHEPEAPIAVIGAGTGLGEGFLIPAPAGHRVFATEGGHTDFAPRSPLEIELLGFLRESLQLTRVSVERVVSGQGIASIYELLRRRGTARESAALAAAFETWKREIGKESPTVDLAAVVSQAAIAEDEPLCTETMDVFVGAYGAEAGNLALKLLPYGGLYVAGGIAPKILPLLERDGFIAAFKDKGRMAPLLERVPVHVVLDSKVGLLGAARHAAELL